MTSPLSPHQLRTVAWNLAAFSDESALRQIEAHRANGDFPDVDCDRLVEASRYHRRWGL